MAQKYIFDLDGTLLEVDRTHQHQFFKTELGDDLGEKFISVYLSLLKEYEENFSYYDIQKLREFLVLKGLNIEEKFLRKWIQYNGENLPSKRIEEVVSLCILLKEKQKRLVVCSNWFKDGQIKRLQRANILELFDGFVFGESALKPHKNAYQLAAGETPFHECVFIGDDYQNDYLVPISFGMKAFYMEREPYKRSETLKKIRGGIEK